MFSPRQSLQRKGERWSLLSDGHFSHPHGFPLVLPWLPYDHCFGIQMGIGLDAKFLQVAGLGLVHMVLGPLALLLLSFDRLSSSCWKGFPFNSIDVGWAKYLGTGLSSKAPKWLETYIP
ncbi:unnamed protein product [Prunus armeniaca]